MCIVIDTNVLGSVFQTNAANHANFKPVKDWVLDGKGKIVFGGSKYIEEIKGKYLVFFNQLKKAGKAIYVNNLKVDAEQEHVKKLVRHKDFDDPHLVGLLRLTGCKLICSGDAKAFPFFRHSTFFSPSSAKPKIYSNLTNSNLLCDRNIAELCKPCAATSKKQKSLIGEGV